MNKSRFSEEQIIRFIKQESPANARPIFLANQFNSCDDADPQPLANQAQATPGM